MMQPTPADWHFKSQLYSFLANSFLKVMTVETSVGLNPEFWKDLAQSKELSGALGNELRSAFADLSAVVQGLSGESDEKAVEKVAVEYTRLFIGPGEPAAPPWESLYRHGGTTVLFGQPTFDMKHLLSKEGYEASKDAHQFEDHLGFELLYLALRCNRFAHELEAHPATKQDLWLQEQADFILEHPLSFIEAMQEKAQAASKVGYYPALLSLTRALLNYDTQKL